MIITATLSTLALIAPGPVADATHATRPCRRACHARRELRRSRKRRRAVVSPHRLFFERVARCESGGRWQINTHNGFYGGLQFTLASWRGVGGSGYPHHHSKLEQMYRGVRLLRVQGPGAWPVCSRWGGRR